MFLRLLGPLKLDTMGQLLRLLRPPAVREPAGPIVFSQE